MKAKLYMQFTRFFSVQVIILQATPHSPLHIVISFVKNQVCFFYHKKLFANFFLLKLELAMVQLTRSNYTTRHISSARNNSRPLAIFRPISTFGRPKSILVGQIYCTFSMGWQLITYKNVLFSKNGRPISDPYFYHCISENTRKVACMYTKDH